MTVLWFLLNVTWIQLNAWKLSEKPSAFGLKDEHYLH